MRTDATLRTTTPNTSPFAATASAGVQSLKSMLPVTTRVVHVPPAGARAAYNVYARQRWHVACHHMAVTVPSASTTAAGEDRSSTLVTGDSVVNAPHRPVAAEYLETMMSFNEENPISKK